MAVKAEAHLGRVYGPLKYEVGLEKVREYASATKNDHPFHHDEVAAAAIGGVIAPAMFAVVPATPPVFEFLSDPEVGIALPKLLHAEQAFTFHRPIRAGETLFTTGTFEELTVKERRGMYLTTFVTRSQDAAGEPVAEGRWVFRVGI